MPDEDAQLCMMLSQASMTSKNASKTMCMQGEIQGHSVSLLIDSGSSHTFLRAALAEKLSGLSELSTALRVQVADGAKLQCLQVLKNASWSIQRCTFQSDLRVLPLHSYDIIVSMDWLEANSPMKVDWRQKWMSIPYGGGSVVLQGDVSDHSKIAAVQVLWVLDAEVSEVAMQGVPPELQQLLNQYSDIFANQVGLPPS